MLNNACKYTEQGTITLSAEVRSSSTPATMRTVTVSVQDTGVGMHKQDIENLEKNINGHLHDIVPKKRHIGLGLFIVSKLAMGLGDGQRLQIESEFRKGSKFSFSVLNRSKNVRSVKYIRKTNKSSPGIEAFTFQEITLLSSSIGLVPADVGRMSMDLPQENSIFVNSSNSISKSYLRTLSRRTSKDKGEGVMSIPDMYKRESFKIVRSISSGKLLYDQFKYASNSGNLLEPNYQAHVCKTQKEKESEDQLAIVPNSGKSVSNIIVQNMKFQSNFSKYQNDCSCTNVLIVDDDHFNLMALSKLFEKKSLAVDSAPNG